MNKVSSITPMMEQYLGLKEEHKDKLLFYRMGDFYELFFEDAEIASSIMGVALTSRGKHLDTDIPMCGVPHQKVDQYLNKLIQAGFIIAICEQVESADEAKKRGYKAIVKRDITRIISPGTTIEEDLFQSSRNNFLFSFRVKNEAFSAVWLDLSTGDIFIKNVSEGSVINLIEEIEPSEVIFQRQDNENIFSPDIEYSFKVTELRENDFLPSIQLKDFIHGYDSAHFCKDEKYILKNLIRYCQETNSTHNMSFSSPIRVSNENFIEMDVFTKNNLELITNSRGERKNTLLSTINRSVTSFGSRLMESWLNYPLVCISDINSRLDRVEILFKHPDTLEKIRSLLKKIPDLERAITRLHIGRGTPIDLNYIKVGLAKSFEINQILKEQRLILLFNNSIITKISDVFELLDSALVEAPSPNVKNGNFIKAGYSEKLDEYRGLQESIKIIVANMQGDLSKKTSITSLKIKFNNTLGYFIETPSSHSKKILSPEFSDLFIHRQSTANSIRFTTKELLQTETEIIKAQDTSLDIEIKIFEELCSIALSKIRELRLLTQFLAQLDVFCSLAELALQNNWIRPKITTAKEFCIKGGRHPVIEESLRISGSGHFIPNDCHLSQKKTFINLLTGPNMAGKSTFLRQNALIGILSHMGSFVPAQEAKIGKISKIFCRMGASDNVSKGESTFMVEMRETALILKNADEFTLVVLDEVGRGTSTYDGMAIAWACLEHLHNENKSRTIFATHYHELTKMSEDFCHIENLSVSAKEWNGELIFLHKILIGEASGSYGIKIAELAGLPDNVIKNAGRMLKEFNRSAHNLKTTNSKFVVSDYEKKEYYQNLDEFKKSLNSVELDTMTPKEALDFLYKNKNIIN